MNITTINRLIVKVTKEVTGMGNPRPIFHTTGGEVIKGTPNLMAWYSDITQLQRVVDATANPVWMKFETDGLGRVKHAELVIY